MQHNYHPAEVMTLEGVTALAAYIKERLETKPIGFTKTIVQARARERHRLSAVQLRNRDAADSCMRATDGSLTSSNAMALISPRSTRRIHGAAACHLPASVGH